MQGFTHKHLQHKEHGHIVGLAHNSIIHTLLGGGIMMLLGKLVNWSL